MPTIPLLLSDSAALVEYKVQLDRMAQDVAREAERIKVYRDYYAGRHDTLLTEDQQAFLDNVLASDEFPPVDNKIPIIVDKLVQRLDVTGFTGTGETEDAARIRAAAQAWEWWDRNGMEKWEREIYTASMRDGESYVLVDYSTSSGRPRFTVEEAYDGDAGIRMFYEDPRTRQKPVYATKHWFSLDPTGETPGIHRVTVYTHDAIYKYANALAGRTPRNLVVRGDGGDNFLKVSDSEDEPWPLPWVERDGEPLGLAVIPFTSRRGSIIAGIIGLNKALNKIQLDMLALADQQGFGLFVAEYPGMMPRQDEDPAGDGLGLKPGRVAEVANGGTLKKLPADDLQGLLKATEHLTITMAGNTATPLHHFRPLTGDIPSGAALKMLEAGHIERAEEALMWYEDAWSDVMWLAQKLERLYGNGGEPVALRPVWAPVHTSDPANDMLEAEGLLRLGLPHSYVWSRLGLSPEEIAQFESELGQSIALLERRAAVAKLFTDMGGSLEGALAAGQIPQELQARLIRSDAVDGLER